MADTRYVVTAPYITMRVKDANSAWVVRGLYKDAQFLEADVDPESLRHHIDNDLVELVEQPKADPPKPAAAKPSAKNS